MTDEVFTKEAENGSGNGDAAASDIAVSGDETRMGSVDQIVLGIVRGIYEGRFVPGQKLIESDLRQKFGVGRGTIREALRSLESEGLVTASLHRGARISIFSRDEVRDILEINEDLIALAASLAAQRLERSQDVDGLRLIHADMVKSLDERDVFTLAKLRYDFMKELVRLTKNRQLPKYLPRFDITVIRTQFRMALKLNQASDDIETFGNIVNFILARNPEKAGETARQYVKDWASSIQSLPDEYFNR